MNRFMFFFERLKRILNVSPIFRRIAYGVFWAVGGGGVARALTLLSSVVVARLLGKVGYGEIGMVQSTLGMMGVLVGFGFGSTATKYIAEFRYKEKVRTGRIAALVVVCSIFFAAAIALACVIFAPWIAVNVLKRPNLETLLLSGALLLFISHLNGVISASLAGFESFRSIAKVNVLRGIASPLVAIPLVWLYGESGAISAFTINEALGLGLYSVSLRRKLREFDIPLTNEIAVFKEWPVLLKHTLPAMLSSLLYSPVIWLTNVILTKQPDGYGELGVFNAANQWRMALFFLPSLVSSVLLPVVAETHGRDDKTDFLETVTLQLRFIWALSLPVTVFIMVMAKPLALLFGREFVGADAIIPSLICAWFLCIVNMGMGTTLVGSGRMWTSMMLNLIWATIMIVSSVALVPSLAGKGLAFAYLISYFFHTIFVYLYIEIKIARGVIVRQWPLLTFSMAVMLSGLIVSSGFRAYYIDVMLLSISLMPGLIMLVGIMKKSDLRTGRVLN